MNKCACIHISKNHQNIYICVAIDYYEIIYYETMLYALMDYILGIINLCTLFARINKILICIFVLQWNAKWVHRARNIHVHCIGVSVRVYARRHVLLISCFVCILACISHQHSAMWRMEGFLKENIFHSKHFFLSLTTGKWSLIFLDKFSMFTRCLSWL